MKPDRSAPQQLTMLLVIEPKPKPLTDAEIDGFYADFYAVYPRRVARQAGRLAFGRILKGKIATIEQLTEGLARYVEYIARNQIETRLQCHPATWINQHRWLDELDAGDDAHRSAPRAQAAGFSRAAGYFRNGAALRR